MPRPCNTIGELNEVIEQLLYRQKAQLRDGNWQTVKTLDKVVTRVSIIVPEMGKIHYTLSADSVKNLWLQIEQNSKALGIKGKILLNWPVDWLPSGWKDDLLEMFASCFFEAPKKEEPEVAPVATVAPTEASTETSVN